MDNQEKQKRVGTSKRKRMKAIQAKIREQMEFYFSDSNIAKDRFMKNLIESSDGGYVVIEAFMKFKKISSLTSDVIQIRKALSHSDFFELNEDKTKVRRKTPIQEIKDLDEKTVYVECLPKAADHQWLKKLFTPCGNITYISIPKFKSTGDRKGFAFVEFETVEAAKRACQDLNNPPVRPGEKTSPGMFPKFNRQLTSMQRKLEEFGENDSEQKLPVRVKIKREKRPRSKNSESSTDLSDVSPKKRRNTLSTESLEGQGESVGSSKKKRKMRDSEGETSQRMKGECVESEDKSNSQKKGKKRKQKAVSDASASESDVSKSGEFSGSETEKKRKISQDNVTEQTSSDGTMTGKSTKERASEKSDQKQKKKMSGGEMEEDTDTQQKIQEVVDVSLTEDTGKGSPTKKKERRKRKKKHKEKCLPELRVMPKLEWLQLKKEYLSLQKMNMNKLKKTLQHMRKEDLPKENTGEVIEEMPDKPTVEIPGTVVHLTSGLPVYRKQLKNDLGSEVHVAYVDVMEGEKEGYVRFKDAASATKTVQHSWPQYQFVLLTGGDEEAYWDKLKSDKMKKYQNKQKKQGKSGQKKLIDRAQKRNKENLDRVHIRFGEED
ncbi:la-related protein 7-like [Saccostrea echinata]|uniref:la-related protein 7-like n=1 Tax=Saccostrea echinata TaxID=191078 RepID=UPI002A7FB539|nr:la-related protein 7-like [Saccostrea echinata]